MRLLVENIRRFGRYLCVTKTRFVTSPVTEDTLSFLMCFLLILTRRPLKYWIAAGFKMFDVLTQEIELRSVGLLVKLKKSQNPRFG